MGSPIDQDMFQMKQGYYKQSLSINDFCVIYAESFSISVKISENLI